MRKLLAFVLVLVFVVSAFAACQDSGGDESEASSKSSAPPSASSEASQEVSADPYAHLRKFDLDQRVIQILVYNDSRDRYKSVEIGFHDDNADVVNDAILVRNETVETLLNCVLKEVRVDDVLATARTDILGDGQYDIILPYMPHAATLAQEGFLIDLTTNFPTLFSWTNPTGTKGPTRIFPLPTSFIFPPATFRF